MTQAIRRTEMSESAGENGNPKDLIHSSETRQAGEEAFHWENHYKTGVERACHRRDGG